MTNEHINYGGIMSNLAQIQVKKDDKTYTVDIEKVYDDGGRFTIILPGNYRIVNKNGNYLDDIERDSPGKLDELFETMCDVDGSTYFGFNIKDLPDTITTFDAIKKFMPTLIGMDYVKILGRDLDVLFHYYNPIFSTDLNNCPTQRIDLCRNEYNEIIENLPRLLNIVVNKYTVLEKAKDNPELKKLMKTHTELTIDDKLKLDPSGKMKIGIDEFGNLLDAFDQFNIRERIDSDIDLLFTILAKLSQLSAYFAPEDRSYRYFIGDMIHRMGGNSEIVNYNRNIMNYSILTWSIEGYPFNLKSDRLYSINNCSNANKILGVLGSLGNLQAFTAALADMDIKDFGERGIDEAADFENEIKALKQTLSVACILLGIKSELISIDKLNAGVFTDRIVQRSDLRTSRRTNKWPMDY